MSVQRQEKEMPFLDHLEELRWRLMWMVGALFAGVLIAFAMMIQFDVVGVLMRPIAPFLQGGRLVFTSPTDPFRIVMMSSVALGAMFALPVMGWHVWAFLSPALYRHEKKVVIPVLLGATLLFMLGVALAFFIILPFTLRFLLGFQTASMAPMITAAGYFGFAISVSLAFGAVFELPIVVVALTSLGIVTPRMMVKFRRHAVVLCLITSAFITPGGDPMTLLVMAGPLYLLYEVSIGLSTLIHRRQTKRAAQALASEGAGA